MFLSVPGLSWEGCCGRKRLSVEGKVLEWRPPLLVVETRRGETLYVRLGPYRFWGKRKLALRPGERVFLQGWLCGEIFLPEVIRFRGKELRLRDERGRPLWNRPWMKRGYKFRRWW